MQDKEKNNAQIDQQFRDQSWAAMHRMLDEEMPVAAKKNGKKRYLLLLLILLVGFVSGIGTMTYFEQIRDFEKPAEVLDVKEELAETSESIDFEKKTNPNEVGLNNSNLPSANNQNIVAAENLMKKNTIKKTQPITNKSLKEPFSTPEITQNSNESNNDFNSKFDYLKNQKQFQNLSENLANKTKQLAALDFISSKPIEIETKENKPNLDFVKIPKTKKMFFGLTMGAYSSRNRPLAGVTFGGKVGYKINRKFSIETGLQYSMLSGYKKKDARTEDKFSSVPIPAEDTSIIDTTTENVTFQALDTIQLQSGKTNLPIARLHYLELPIDVSFHLSKKFQIHLGMKAGYLLHAKAESFSNEESDPLTANTADKNGSNRDLYKSLKKFDFTAFAGVGFYPTKNLGIELRYNHGFVDFTKDDRWLADQDNQNRNLQLSTVYRFGK